MVQAPLPASPPPLHSPTIPQHQAQATQMEADNDGFKRQLSGGAQVAVIQASRPMPSPQAESFHHGNNAMEYARLKSKPLGPPSKAGEPRGAHVEQLQPSHNALSVFAQTGSIQAPQMGSLGSGPFGTSHVLGQPSGSRPLEPMFPASFGHTSSSSGQFGMPTAAAPTVPPRIQLSA